MINFFSLNLFFIILFTQSLNGLSNPSIFLKSCPFKITVQHPIHKKPLSRKEVLPKTKTKTKIKHIFYSPSKQEDKSHHQLLFNFHNQSNFAESNKLSISRKKYIILKKLLRISLQIFYYSVYYISSLFCDFLAIGLVIIIQHFISLNLPMFLALFLCIKIFLSGLDSLTTERTKKYLKKFNTIKMNTFKRWYFIKNLEKQISHLAYYNSISLYPKSYNEFLIPLRQFHKAIQRTKNFPENSTAFLILLLTIRDKNQFHWNQFLFLLNVTNMSGFFGKDIIHLYQTLKDQNLVKEYLINPKTHHLTSLERYILLHTYYFDTLNKDASAKNDLTLFLIDHLKDISQTNDIDTSYYTTAICDMCSTLISIEQNSDQMAKENLEMILDKICTTTQKGTNLLLIKRLFSIFPNSSPVYKSLSSDLGKDKSLFIQTHLAFLTSKNEFHKKLIEFYKDLANDEKTTQDPNSFDEILNKKKFILHSMLSFEKTQHTPSHREELIRFYVDNIKDLKIDKEDPFLEQKNNFASSSLLSIVNYCLRDKENTQETKEQAIKLIQDVINSKEQESSFSSFLESAKNLLHSIKNTSYSNDLFGLEKLVDNNPKDPFNNQLKYKFYSQDTFYFTCLYTFGAAFTSGFITVIFLNPFFTIIVSPYLIAAFIGIGVSFLQIAKGWSRMRSYFYATVPSEHINYYWFKKNVEILSNNKTFQSTYSFMQEKFIFDAFNKLFAKINLRPTIKDWRSFYIQCLSKTKRKDKLVFALSKFAIFIKKNPRITDEEHLFSLYKTIKHLARQYEIPETEYFHFFNIIHYKYICSIDTLLSPEGHLNHLELLSQKLSDKPSLFRIKFLHLLSLICQSDLTPLVEKKRIMRYIINEIKTTMTTNFETFNYLSQSIFVLSGFLNSDDPIIWETCYNILIDEIDFSIESTTMWASLFRQTALTTEKITSLFNLMDQNSQSSEKIKKIIFFIIKTDAINSSKKGLFYRLPSILYKRYTEYSIIALCCFSLTVFIARSLFITFDIFSLTGLYFIVPILILNLIGLIGRVEKDFIEQIFDKQVYAFDIRNRSNIKKRKLKQHLKKYNLLKKEFNLNKKKLTEDKTLLNHLLDQLQSHCYPSSSA